MKKVIILLILGAILASGGFWYWQHSGDSPTAFRTAVVKRGDLQVTIGATGTLEPEEVVDVGAQVAGLIKEFGPDPRNSAKLIDYDTAVEEGTVLAKIDDRLYKAAEEQAQASLGQAQANLKRAEADLNQMKAKLVQAEKDWTRVKVLGPTKAVADVDYDTAQANYETAKANVAVDEAAIQQARQNVVQAQAALNQAQINLGYCTIKSPVKGVIIDRRVNIGQTVVSSLNAPSLFLIAKDLKKLQVWASVNEADIGQIREGQKVTFTVDAFPGETFQGVVDQVRLNATMNQNVVTYTVVVGTDNSSGKLKPYLTANVKFQIEEHRNVLMAPNAALHWQPQPYQVAPDARDALAKAKSERRQSGNAGKPGDGARSEGKPPDATAGTGGPAKAERGMLWAEDGGFVRPMRVHVGMTDGLNTEVQSDQLKEGTTIVLGEQRSSGPAGGGEAVTNPFAPKLFGGKKTQ
jgi:HlyD family secretion protein